MFKITLFFTTILLGLLSFTLVNPDQKKSTNKGLSLENPQDALLSFSYDMEVVTYNKLLDEADRGKLQSFQRFMFTPQRQKMHVNGYVDNDGSPNIEIRILEKTNRAWAKHPNKNPKLNNEIHRIIMQGNRVTSYNDVGDEVISVSTDPLENKELTKNFQLKIEPEVAFIEFLKDAENQGWKLQENKSYLILGKAEKAGKSKLFFEKTTGLLISAETNGEKEVQKISYSYECIEGKYVLILKRTSIVKKEANPNIPLTEYISLVQLDNIIFNQ